MSHHPRRILTTGVSRKRKEREAYYPSKLSAPAQAAANTTITSKAASTEPVCTNLLLAGYMAYEFLTKGALLGQKFDQTLADEVQLAGSTKPEEQQEPSVKRKHKSYAELASILKTDGAHIPGIVNPTQLVKWIQM